MADAFDVLLESVQRQHDAFASSINDLVEEGVAEGCKDELQQAAAVMQGLLSSLLLGAQLGSFACSGELDKFPKDAVEGFFREQVSSSVLAMLGMVTERRVHKTLSSYCEAVEGQSERYEAMSKMVGLIREILGPEAIEELDKAAKEAVGRDTGKDKKKSETLQNLADAKKKAKGKEND